jgi:hypothetical protein
MNDPDIEDFDYILSSVGNAYFSGVSFDQLWSCISISESREDLDAAVDATIRLNDIKDQ